MAEISGVYSPPVYTPPPVEQAVPPPVEVAPVEQVAPEATNLAAEMGIGANIDVSA
ncbi:hypothetical protein KAJ27_09445 [bacterium]|nr:hypothetical protein [bacterium]